jgi:hypothetical protein
MHIHENPIDSAEHRAIRITSRARTMARNTLSLVGVTGVAIIGGTGVAKAEQSLTSAADRGNTYLASGTPNSSPIQEAKLSNKTEIALLTEIRQHKHEAFILNGAIEFHGKTTIYLGPAAKGHRISYDTNPPGNELVSYYPMVTAKDGVLWAAVFDNHHSQANAGQGSAYGSIGWAPLKESHYTVYRNTSNGAPGLLKFHEVYDAHPQGEGVSPIPAYNIFADGSSTQLPRSDAIMDTEIWPATTAQANLKAGGFTPLGTQTAENLFSSIKL